MLARAEVLKLQGKWPVFFLMGQLFLSPLHVLGPFKPRWPRCPALYNSCCWLSGPRKGTWLGSQTQPLVSELKGGEQLLRAGAGLFRYICFSLFLRPTLTKAKITQSWFRLICMTLVTVAFFKTGVFHVWFYIYFFESLCPALSLGFHCKTDLCCVPKWRKGQPDFFFGLPRLQMNICFPWKRVRSPRAAVSP